MNRSIVITIAVALLFAFSAYPGGESSAQVENVAEGSGSGGNDSVEIESNLEHGLPPKGASFHWLKSADDYLVASWYWAPKAAGAPAVILIHMRGQDKSSWHGLPGKLHDEGYAVIALDLRGHGETRDPQARSIPLDSLEDSDYRAMLNDVAAAHGFLKAQPEVDSDRLATIGASIGANLSIMYASTNRSIRTAVALSPGLDYRSLIPADYLEAFGKRPLYLVASEGDEYSAESAARLEELALHAEPVSVRIFPGKAHGTDILRDQQGFDDTIASGWMLNYIPPKR